MEIQTLTSTWWYRLLKVIYIITFIFVLSFSIFIINDIFRPQLDYSYYKCANGKELKGSEIPMKTFGTSGLKLPDLTQIKNICNEKYEIVRVYKEKDWKSTIGFSLLAFIVIFFIFEIIKGIFFYVATGKWVAFKFRKRQ